MERQSEPILNVPAVVSGLIALFVIVHAVRKYLLSTETDVDLLLLFAFIPARYSPSLFGGETVPGGLAADVWTFVTYAFIHGDWMHLGFNAVWFLAFGSAVARRLGAVRFLLFFAMTAAAGAAMHLLTRSGDEAPMIGASAAISGCMAGAMRFVFQRGGPLDFRRRRDAAPAQAPAVSLIAALSDARILAFLGVWFGLNLIFGMGAVAFAGEQQEIAWQAHIGGFLAGLLLFALFDPVRAMPPDHEPPPLVPD